MSSGLKPFWRYYGGKWRIAPRYPAPVHDTIVEPFAGAAGYSMRWPNRNVILCDADPIIAGLWAYLIRTPAAEIRALPAKVETVDDIHGPQEARWLVGFWLNAGVSAPCRTPGAWMRSGDYSPCQFWGEPARERVARQVDAIRHWCIIHGSWESALDFAHDWHGISAATWYVDPPYSGKPGQYYRHHDIDYSALGQWCRNLHGQVIVCENEGAEWLPFRPFHNAKAMTKGGGRVSREAIWTNDAASAAGAA
jgi:hypothetical protein